jgi:hypothetical protein
MESQAQEPSGIVLPPFDFPSFSPPRNSSVALVPWVQPSQYMVADIINDSDSEEERRVVQDLFPGPAPGRGAPAAARAPTLTARIILVMADLANQQKIVNLNVAERLETLEEATSMLIDDAIDESAVIPQLRAHTSNLQKQVNSAYESFSELVQVTSQIGQGMSLGQAELTRFKKYILSHLNKLIKRVDTLTQEHNEQFENFREYTLSRFVDTQEDTQTLRQQCSDTFTLVKQSGDLLAAEITAQSQIQLAAVVESDRLGQEHLANAVTALTLANSQQTHDLTQLTNMVSQLRADLVSVNSRLEAVDHLAQTTKQQQEIGNQEAQVTRLSERADLADAKMKRGEDLLSDFLTAAAQSKDGAVPVEAMNASVLQLRQVFEAKQEQQEQTIAKCLSAQRVLTDRFSTVDIPYIRDLRSRCSESEQRGAQLEDSLADLSEEMATLKRFVKDVMSSEYQHESEVDTQSQYRPSSLNVPGFSATPPNNHPPYHSPPDGWNKDNSTECGSPMAYTHSPYSNSPGPSSSTSTTLPLKTPKQSTNPTISEPLRGHYPQDVFQETEEDLACSPQRENRYDKEASHSSSLPPTARTHPTFSYSYPIPEQPVETTPIFMTGAHAGPSNSGPSQAHTTDATMAAIQQALMGPHTQALLSKHIRPPNKWDGKPGTLDLFLLEWDMYWKVAGNGCSQEHQHLPFCDLLPDQNKNVYKLKTLYHQWTFQMIRAHLLSEYAGLKDRSLDLEKWQACEMKRDSKGSALYMLFWTEWNHLAEITGQLSSLQMWDQWQRSVTSQILEMALTFKGKEDSHNRNVTLDRVHAEVLSRLGIKDQLFARMNVANRLRSRSVPVTPVNQVGDGKKNRRKSGKGTEEEEKPEDVNYISPGAAGKTVRVPRTTDVKREVCKECLKPGHTIDKCHKKHPHLFDEWLKKREAKEQGDKAGRGPGGKKDEKPRRADSKDGKRPRTCWICSEFRKKETDPASLLHGYADCPRKKKFDAKDKAQAGK